MGALRGVGPWLLVLALAPEPTVALSIFDIIQLGNSGYTDKQIIALIESTASMFELEAEDLPRLKQLGIGEAVIRAMLERAPAEAPGNWPEDDATPSASGAASVSVEEATDRHEHAEKAPGDNAKEGLGPGSERPEPGRATQPLVSFHPVQEERSGDHFHMALTLSGLEVLILRDEGTFPSMQARALKVAQRLDAALALGDGAFYMSSGAGGPSVVFRGAVTHQRITVLEVSAADARAYELRSGRQVTRGVLAAYWADLLSDFGAIAMGRRPSRTLALHDGDALGVLYQALRSSVGQGGGLRAAAELLPSSVKHHLERLASAVPIDYDRGGILTQ